VKSRYATMGTPYACYEYSAGNVAHLEFGSSRIKENFP
jgi:hypothetical protein